MFRKILLASAAVTVMCLISRTGKARVFDFKEKTFSTYLRGTYGLSTLQQYSYQPGFPSTVSFNGNVNQQFSGEIGFGFTSSEFMTLRIGVEILDPQTPTGLAGNDSSGNKLLSLDSQVYSLIPQVNLETFVKRWPNSRLYLGGGVGYAVTTIKNTVTMTAKGTSTLGVSDYIEEGSGWGYMGQGFLGYEFVLFDNVGFSLDVGYRYLVVNNYTANRSFTSPAGSFTQGNPIKNYDQTNRSTDLSGPFAGATFRIYIQ